MAEPSLGTDTVLWVVGMIGVLLVNTIGMVKYLVTKIEKEDDVLHARINDVREQFVRRDDLAKELQHFEHSLERMHADMRDHTAHINSRIDTIITTMTQLFDKTVKDK